MKNYMKPKPKQLRFSVRSLLVLMAAVSPILATVTNLPIGAIVGYGLLIVLFATMSIVVWDTLFDPFPPTKLRQPGHRLSRCHHSQIVDKRTLPTQASEGQKDIDT